MSMEYSFQSFSVKLYGLGSLLGSVIAATEEVMTTRLTVGLLRRMGRCKEGVNDGVIAPHGINDSRVLVNRLQYIFRALHSGADKIIGVPGLELDESKRLVLDLNAKMVNRCAVHTWNGEAVCSTASNLALFTTSSNAPSASISGTTAKENLPLVFLKMFSRYWPYNK